MGFNVTFYQFRKRDNSTLRPTDENTIKSRSVEVVLKEDCSIMYPRLQISSGDKSSPEDYNYCYIKTFERYYFINDWTYETGRIWTAACYVDVLATYRYLIGTSTLYVLRAASEWDDDVIDVMYPAKATTYFGSASANLPGVGDAGSDTDYRYIVKCVTNESSNGGTTVFYNMSHYELDQFMDFMFSEIKSWDSISDFSGDVAKAFIDPAQYIAGAIAVKGSAFKPLDTDAIKPVKFGFWDSGLKAHVLNTAVVTTTPVTFGRPDNPYASGHGNWVYIAPFAKYYFYAEPWGLIELDSTLARNGVKAQVVVDRTSGDALLRLTAANFDAALDKNTGLITVARANVAADVPVGGTNFELPALSGGGLVNAAINTGISALAGLFSDADIGDAASAALTSGTVIGSNGTFLDIACLGEGKASFIAIYYKPVDENLEEHGKPLCARRQINTLNGYVEVMDGDIAIQGTSDEAARIKEYLEGGFYFE